ncbi:MAG: hypothetical protein M1834_004584 [Cirrosporium novae-zelandiae]|nr:MAG: hypothetical protein M1834_004584 [Cirrosporium novae-zelandiae]
MASSNVPHQETFRSAFPDIKKPYISYGLPFPEACAKRVEETFHASRVYIISSGSLARKTDALKNLKQALGDKVVGTRVGLESHSLWSEILEVTRDAKEAKADILVTLGAGTLTDSSKIITLVEKLDPVNEAISNDVSSIDDIESLSGDATKKRGHVNEPTIPVISIPTSLSGGEYSNFAGGTDDRTHRKHMFGGPIKGPALVILDAELSTTTPEWVWLSTGIRSVDHCVEALCSTKGTPQSDARARDGLRKLVPALLATKHDPQALEPRRQAQMAVMDAMKAVSSGYGNIMGGSHGIGHQLGPLGVGHGETSCILLPAVCKYNLHHGDETARKRQDAVRELLWEDGETKAVLQRRGLDECKADLGDVLDAVVKELGMPRSLKDVKVGRDKLDQLAENSLHDPWCADNPVPLKEKSQVLEILEMALGE